MIILDVSKFLYTITKEINQTVFNLTSLLPGLCPSSAWLPCKSSADRTYCPQLPKKTNPQLQQEGSLTPKTMSHWITQ